jgi:iron complex outermembrane receptor protein
LQVQSFFDLRPRNDPKVKPRQNTADVDIQYHVKAGRRHDIVVGTGYRHTNESLAETFNFSILPTSGSDSVANAFVQDEIAMAANRVHLTVGSKIEYDTHAGTNVSPTARIMWTLPHAQRLWGAVSRAVRTPSLDDLGARINYAVFMGDHGVPVVLGNVGNPNYLTEKLLSTEVGYRVEIATIASVDVTGFRSHYDDLKTLEPLAPTFVTSPGPPHVSIVSQFGNQLQADTAGIEMAVHVKLTTAWGVDGSYTGFRYTPQLAATSGDTLAARGDAVAPVHQWQLHSAVNVGRTEFDAAVFRVGALSTLIVPAYIRVDARVERRLSPQWSIEGSVQNLFNDIHPEFGGLGTPVVITSIPRSAALRARFSY